MIFSRLYDYCTITPTTRIWFVGWWNLIVNSVLLTVFGFVIPNNDHLKEVLQFLCNQQVCKLVAVIKGMELLFSIILLHGIYTGRRTFILTWIVAAASIAGASLIIFSTIIILTSYYILSIAFIFTAACDLYHVIAAIQFYNFKQAEYDCGP